MGIGNQCTKEDVKSNKLHNSVKNDRMNKYGAKK